MWKKDSPLKWQHSNYGRRKRPQHLFFYLANDFQTISKVTPGEVNHCLSFSEDLSINKINIFPVPTFGEIAIHSEVGIREVQLLNCFGTFVKELKEGVSDLCDLPSGVYILKIIDINNKEYINKISKLWRNWNLLESKIILTSKLSLFKFNFVFKVDRLIFKLKDQILIWSFLYWDRR